STQQKFDLFNKAYPACRRVAFRATLSAETAVKWYN
ncbi:hypothetical protein SSYM_1550, partial [Serratia symbiotica str. Tucson]